MKSRIVLLIVAAVLLAVAPAKADLLYLQGVNYPDVTATVNFDYAWVDANDGTISVTLANTSAIASAFTGFAFNAPSNVTDLGTFTGPNSDWSAVYSPNSINTPGQFGFFDLAAITGPNFNGGTPLNGIWNGVTGTFSIGVTGTDMDTLTTASFLSLFSSLNGFSGIPLNFIGRVQAIGTEGLSDVASQVPIPATALLLGSGLIGLVGIGWRRKEKA